MATPHRVGVGLPLQVLFECLDIGNILFALSVYMACERKVLLVSS